MRPPPHSLRQKGKWEKYQEEDLHPTAEEEMVTPSLRKYPGIWDTWTVLFCGIATAK